jgi:hypothetical protein
MNWYAALTFAFLGTVFIVYGLDWLGIVFFVLGLIALIYRKDTKFLKKMWEDVSKAEGSYPSGKLKEYTKSSAKQLVSGALIIEDKYERHSVSIRPDKASKSLVDELKNIFK